MAEAKELARGRNIDAAEQKLIALNASEPSSSAWHIETASRLLRLADDLAREGAGNQVAALANRTLQRLSEAEAAAKLRNDALGQAHAKSLAGWIHERYRGDIRTALASYRDAAQLAPADRSIREAFERLQQADVILRARVRTTKR